VGLRSTYSDTSPFFDVVLAIFMLWFPVASV